jgi:hypothetical protein
LFFFVAFGIDGTNSYIYLLKQTSAGALDHIPNLYTPTASCASLLAAAWALHRQFFTPSSTRPSGAHSMTAPRSNGNRSASLVAIIAAINLLILTDSPIILYPIAYISALGTLGLLVTVFMIVMDHHHETG